MMRGASGSGSSSSEARCFHWLDECFNDAGKPKTRENLLGNTNNNAKVGPGETCPKSEKPAMKNPKLVQIITEKIMKKVDKCQNFIMTFTDNGSWELENAPSIPWRESLKHLEPQAEMIIVKTLLDTDCACKEKKVKEDQRTKIKTSIQSKIEAQQSFAVFFTSTKTAWIYELSPSDVSLINYIAQEKESVSDTSHLPNNNTNSSFFETDGMRVVQKIMIFLFCILLALFVFLQLLILKRVKSVVLIS